MLDKHEESLCESELLQIIRKRILDVGATLTPAVSAQIGHLEQRNRIGRSVRTISYQDLIAAIDSGQLPSGGAHGRNPDGSWSVTINGVDQIGEGITVTVRCSSDSREPICIENFVLPQP